MRSPRQPSQPPPRPTAGARVRSFLFGAPSPAAADENRSVERYRRSLLSGTAATLARATQVACTVASVSLVLPHLGPERFGLWTTVTGLSLLLAFADLGLGNGLITSLARAAATDDRAHAQRLVSSAFYALLAIGAVTLALGAAASGRVPWPAFFNVSDPRAAEEAGPSALAFLAVFSLSVPLTLVQKIHLGFQEGYVASAFQAAGNLLGLCGVVVGVAHLASAPALVTLAMSGPLVAALANGAWLFGARRRWLWPRPGLVDRATLGELRRLGLLFFTLQLATAVAFASDNLVVAHVLGQPEVARYSVHAQPFTWVAGLASVFLVPLWPAYGDALARGDLAWVRATLRRSLALTVAATALPGLVLTLAGRPLLRLWVGDQLAVDTTTLAALAVWTVVAALGSAMSVLLNAAGVVRFQVLTAAAMTVSVLAARTFGAHVLGLQGLVWGTLAAYAVTSLAPTGLYLRSWVRRQEASARRG